MNITVFLLSCGVIFCNLQFCALNWWIFSSSFGQTCSKMSSRSLRSVLLMRSLCSISMKISSVVCEAHLHLCQCVLWIVTQTCPSCWGGPRHTHTALQLFPREFIIQKELYILQVVSSQLLGQAVQKPPGIYRGKKVI